MKTVKKSLRRMMAFLLTTVMCLGMTVTAFATEGTENVISQIVNEGGKVYYLANGEEANAENFDVWTSKTIEETGIENEFEVTLQVGSTKKAKTEDVAVVLVMDVSSSMLQDKNGKWTINNTGWKNYMPVEGPLMIDYARDAAQEFVVGLVDHAGDASVKLAMVEFGNNARTVFNWMEANVDGKVPASIIDSIEKLDVGFSIDEDEIEGEPSSWDLKISNASFWAPARDESGNCYYVEADGSYCELTDPFHTHDCTGAKLCYWIERQASFWDKTASKCLYEGCKDTNASHMHDVKGCTYIFDNNRCDNPDPYHYHEFTLSDCDAANSTFGWNTNGTMYQQRHLLTDDSGVKHLCVDYEILRQKSGGTNMEGGLLLANNLVNVGLAEGGSIEDYKNVYVIMLSDGEPTFHVAPDADRTSLEFVSGERGTSKNEWVDMKNIVFDGTEGDLAYAKDIKENAALYTVMYGYVGDKVTPVANDSKGAIPAGTTVKQWLTNTGTNMVGVDDLYMAMDIENGLMEAFGNIGERIELLSKAWTVTDALSDEVAFDSFSLNGEYASYDKDDHAITWHVGDMEPENADAAGTVADPYVYTLKYKVKLNPDAEGVYEASADNTGVNTNKGATLYYIQTDDDTDLKKLPYDELKAKAKEAAFEHPSVKAFYTEYEFTKKSAKDENILANVGFTLYKDGAVWSDEIFSDAEGKVKFERLSAGEYKMRETTVLDGMQYMAPFEFVVSYGKITTKSGAEMPDVIYNDTNERVLEFSKNTEIDGELYALKGIEFEIYYVGTVEDYNTFIDTVAGSYGGAAEDFAAAVQEKFTVSKADEIRVKGTEPVATVKTDEAGHAVYNLTENKQPDGIYMIIEKPHNAIAKTLAPFVVAVPSTNEDGNPVYHLELKLKNEIFRPEVDKDVAEIGQKEESQNVGDNVTWIVRGDIPKDIKDAQLYKLTDVVDYRLTYAGNPIVKVELIEDEANNSPTVGTLLVDGTDYTLNATSGTVDVNPDENVTQMEDITTIVAELTQAGREKIATIVGDAYDTYELRVYFDTYIDEDAQLGIEIPNTVTLEYTNSANFEWKVVPEENPEVYTCGINIHKYDAKDNNIALTGAEFMLAREATDADRATDGVVIEQLVIEKGVAKDVVFVEFYDNAALTGNKVNTVTSNETGDAIVYGLEAGDYYLVETKAPAGYNLLSYPLKVTLNKTSHVAANTVGVANSNTFELPSTGGIGTTIFTLVGAALTLGSGAVLVGKKRKEDEEE